MQDRQQGMTFIGILVIVIVVGAWVYSGIRLVPRYLEYVRVASTLEKVRDEFSANPGSTEFMLRKAIERHFDIESVTVIDVNDIEITKDGGSFYMRANYENTVPLVSNISFLLTFDKTVEVAAR
jgi:hypothetical protein